MLTPSVAAKTRFDADQTRSHPAAFLSNPDLSAETMLSFYFKTLVTVPMYLGLFDRGWLSVVSPDEKFVHAVLWYELLARVSVA